MQVIETIENMRGTRSAWGKLAFVPTMGALHAGHMSLVKAAKEVTEKVVVSIFVNPLQFGPNEDLTRYPRPIEKDIALLDEAGVTALFLPNEDMLYPDGFRSRVEVAGLSDVMDGAFRPGHFAGVTTVVAKLFNIVQPDVAIFGEKDFQQLTILRRMVSDLNMDIEIMGAPIARAQNGLALSSRNAYLSEHEKAIAPVLYWQLQKGVERIRAGQPAAKVERDIAAALMAAGFASVDYVELRRESDLEKLEVFEQGSRLLAAAHLGNTRLIDNVKVG